MTVPARYDISMYQVDKNGNRTFMCGFTKPKMVDTLWVHNFARKISEERKILVIVLDKDSKELARY